MDNYDAWLADDIQKERWRESRPMCAFCKKHIDDEYAYRIENLTGGLWLCESCAEEHAEKLAEEYKNECLDSWKRDNY